MCSYFKYISSQNPNQLNLVLNRYKLERIFPFQREKGKGKICKLKTNKLPSEIVWKSFSSMRKSLLA